MTYRELKKQIDSFTDEQLSMDVTILDCGIGEYFASHALCFAQNGHDILDDNHPYLILDA